MGARIRTSRGLLPSAVYTETQTTIAFLDTVARGLRFYLNVTDAGTGSGGLAVIVCGVDKISRNLVPLSTGGVPVQAVGTWVYEFGPFAGGASAIAGSVMDSAQRSLPFEWAAQVVAGDESPYTYSLSVEITD
jgi:hypothetical protein